MEFDARSRIGFGREGIVGVFTVRERRGDDVVFEAGGSRRTYEVLEHSPETEYGPGFVGLGRLIPFEGRYLPAQQRAANGSTRAARSPVGPRRLRGPGPATVPTALRKP